VKEFSAKQYEAVAAEWDKMSKLPESGEPWALTQFQWDCVSAALKIAASHADEPKHGTTPTQKLENHHE